jgi:peptidyl-prolyl cis-trans isomerase A (cyclophilin A)
MRKFLFVIAAIVALSVFTGCRGKPKPVLHEPGATRVWPTVDTAELQQRAESRPRVELVTTVGTIVLELYEEEAPVSVANFLQYVKDGFYEGTVFHRIEPGMVVQAGGFTASMDRKETRDPIPNEASNGLRNLRGTLGMARTMEMASGTSQFYINLVDNRGFNGDGVTSGYAVFGRVYEGMDVVDSMVLVETTRAGGMNNVPVEPIIIQSARQIK